RVGTAGKRRVRGRQQRRLIALSVKSQGRRRHVSSLEFNHVAELNIGRQKRRARAARCDRNAGRISRVCYSDVAGGGRRVTRHILKNAAQKLSISLITRT